MSWNPDITAVTQLHEILQGTLSSDPTIRTAATNALSQAKTQADFANYLLYILVLDSSSGVTPQVKASAGLALKNSIYKDFSIGGNTYLLGNVCKGLSSDVALVRNITGTVISSIFASLGVSKWPSIIPELIGLVEGQAGATAEGAANTLTKICEDSGHILNAHVQGGVPLDFIVPKFIELTHSNSPKVRADILNSLNHLMLLKSQSFLVYLDDFLTRLFTLAVDPSAEVRRNVCASFTNVLETRPDKLVPYLNDVINYALHSITENANDEGVALEACEFLLSLSTSDIPDDMIRPHLANILPVLLAKLVYTEDEVAEIEAQDEEDANQEDKDEDIRPTAAKVKTTHTNKNTSNQQASANGENNDDAEDDDEDDDDDDDYNTEWTIRRCAGATLDVLTSVLPSEVLDIILPILRSNITSEQWPIREASILAFGAVAEGGSEYAEAQLPALIPYLVERLRDPSSSVRQITCWTLGRYAPWICSQASEGGSFSGYFDATFGVVLQCCLDVKKTVQQSSCSAVAHFIESIAPELIQPYSADLINTFERCFQTYKRINLIVLYDALQTLIDRIELTDEQISRILPILLSKWEVLSDDDKELWPLLECMSSVAVSLGHKFAPYALQVYERALRILSNCLEMEKMVSVTPGLVTPEKDFIITSVDLIDGLVQGLEEHSLGLINSCTTLQLMPLLLETFNDTIDDVRQSSFALLGDLAINTPSLLQPYLSDIFGSVAAEIIARSENNFPVVNNAVWATGEMSLRLNLGAYLDRLSPLLIDLLKAPAVNDTLLENTAITLGRFGVNHSEHLSSHLPEFITPWIQHVTYLEENEEKESAFSGMINIIKANPTALNNHETLIMFMNCVNSYAEPGPKLAGEIREVLLAYKELLGADVWSGIVSSVANSLELIHNFGL
ncbi:hypothetical protein WICPIJ_006575 [Wickerhamomyces pijperi]|uniref:Importin N-terminal domain-containing protein n=1 Tax=Wickerhamomyces pijperi TaxID=599730 RepID=A0A9P8Q3J8_WICPI|nr:hypothetical protein WICPIJ_006575 [Wickerhamomyces pijperi]